MMDEEVSDFNVTAPLTYRSSFISQEYCGLVVLKDDCWSQFQPIGSLVHKICDKASEIPTSSDSVDDRVTIFCLPDLT